VISAQTTNAQFFKEDTYFMTFRPKVDRLCSLDSSSRSDDCFEFYFTKKGNVIYKHYSPNEIEAWFYFGSYSLSDTGITYTTTDRYYVKMKLNYRSELVDGVYIDKTIDTTDYNKGKHRELSPFVEFIEKNNCKEFPYAIAPENSTKRVRVVINTPHTVSPGSVFEKNDTQKEILARKIKTIKLFQDL
jgi:hypothetical protein